MKKFFKSLMLGLAVIPASFMFVACGPKDKDPEPPAYNKEANVTALNSAVDKVELVGDNYTQTMSTNSTGIFDSDNGVSPTAVSGDNGITSVAKFDGANFVQEIAGQKIYYIDGVVYVDQTETGATSPSLTAMEIAMPNLGMGATDLAEMLANLQDFAFTTNEEAVVATSNDVTITIELADMLNTILDVVSLNVGSNLETLINALISELTGSEATVQSILTDIEAWANETTVEDIVGEENIAEIKILAGTIIAYTEIANLDPSSMDPSDLAAMFPYGGDSAVVLNSQILPMVLGTINSVANLTIDEILVQLEEFLELDEETDIYDFVLTMLRENSVAKIVTSLTILNEEEAQSEGLLEEITYDQYVAFMLASNTTQISESINAITLNKVTATAKINLVNNAFAGIDLVFDLDADIAMDDTNNMDINGKLEASFELSEVGTTEIELPANAVYTAMDSYLVDLGTVIDGGDDDGKIIITGVESKILDLVAPNGVEIKSDDDTTTIATIVKVAGEGTSYTYTITLSTDLVARLTEGMAVAISERVGNNMLMLNLIVDIEIPQE